MKKTLVLLLSILMCILLCACGSDDNNAADSSEVGESSSAETTQAPEENKSIDLTTEKGAIKYVGFEKANEKLVDEENVVVVKFEFTNFQEAPSQSQSAFGIQFFQNGVELSDSLSWSSEGGDQYELVNKYFSSVMKNGTVTYGKLVKLTDDSPLTIMVMDSLSSDNYQMMEINIKDTDKAAEENTEGTNADVSEEATTEAVTETAYKAIKAGDVIETEGFDFTLNKVELTYELKPQNTSSVYTSYEAEDGKVYIHIDGTYLNKSKKDVCIRDLFIPHADYDDGYTYDGFVVVDDGDNSFDWVSSYVACTPLEEWHYHGLIECPETVDNSEEALFVTFEIDGTTYKYDIR